MGGFGGEGGIGGIEPGTGGVGGIDPSSGPVANLRARRRDVEQVRRSIMERKRLSKVVVGPTTSTIAVEKHVLQKDFLQVVGSPTGGYVEAQITRDADGGMRVYTSPGAAATAPLFFEKRITPKSCAGSFDITLSPTSTTGYLVEIWETAETVAASGEAADRLECEQIIAQGVVVHPSTARIYWQSSGGPVFGYRRFAYRIIAI